MSNVSWMRKANCRALHECEVLWAVAWTVHRNSWANTAGLESRIVVMIRIIRLIKVQNSVRDDTGWNESVFNVSYII